MGIFDFFATDPSFRDADEAEDRYVQQVGTISAAKGWPIDVREALLNYPWDPNFQASDAQAVYLRVWYQEPRIIEGLGYSTSQLANYDKHRNAIRELAEASGLTTQALSDASIGSQVSGAISATSQDVASTIDTYANPKKSPWPWIIGIGAAFLLARELELGSLIKGRR